MPPTIPLVLALFRALQPGAERVASPEVVSAIAGVADTELEAAELVVYSWYESSAQVHPVAVSWDARGGVSCGFLQLRCSLSTTPEHDARVWLGIVRSHGLAAVDGSPARAAHRLERARGLLRVVAG